MSPDVRPPAPPARRDAPPDQPARPPRPPRSFVDERLFSVDLLVAEGLKLAHAPFLRGLFGVATCGIGVVLALYGLLANDGVTLRWPACQETIASGLAFLLMVLPATVFGFVVGNEQAADTWKSVLVRRPHRLPFVTAKIVAATLTLGAVLTAAAFSWGAVLPALAAVFGAAPAAVDPLVAATQEPPMTTAALLGELTTSALEAAVVGGLAASLALVARAQATVVGIVGAGAIALGVGMLAMGTDGAVAAALYQTRAAHLGTVLGGVPGPATRMDWDASGDVVVLALWLVLPLGIATTVFCRRDQLSSVG